jgi:hypothetical protein
MLQEDRKEPLQVGGTLTPQLMTLPTPSPGRNSGTIQRATRTQGFDEAQEVGVPCTEAGSDVCE